MNDALRSRIFFVNFEILFELRSLFIAALRYLNHKYPFTEVSKFSSTNLSTSNLFSMLEVPSHLRQETLKIVEGKLITLKPRLYFIFNFIFSQNPKIQKYIYPFMAEGLELEFRDRDNFFNFFNKELGKYSCTIMSFVSEKNVSEKITEVITQGEIGIVIDSSVSRIEKFVSAAPNLTVLFLKGKNTFEETTHKKWLTSFEDFSKEFGENIDSLNEKDQFVFYYEASLMKKNFSLLSLWQQMIVVEQPIVLTGKIVSGFQRGSKKLGVPTANLEMTDEIKSATDDFISGVYSGFCVFKSNKSNNPLIDLNSEMKCVLSIGWNPYYNNTEKTIEIFLIDYVGENFYGEEISLTIKHFMRSECDFENFQELVTAITFDILTANKQF